MSKTVKLSNELVLQAGLHAKNCDMSASQIIEYWARLGKFADDHADLVSYQMIELFNLECSKPNRH